MSITLFSVKFLLFSASSVLVLALLGGVARQLAFLLANIFFIWSLLGTAGTLSTVAYCLLGYSLTRIHLRWPGLSIYHTLPVFIALFIYMRNYDFLQWFLPQEMLTNVLSTVGLSFLFFKIIHVLIDARSNTLRKLDFLTYINYSLNFTTFMMGPIQRYQDYYDQWYGHKHAIAPTFEAHLDAVLRILIGLVKAFILASWIGKLALQPDTDVLQLGFSAWVIQLYAFFFYLYLNFSGYCDIVIGIGSLFGVRPPENFNKPFIAQNISDFWLRQHRSLTLWLTDYVFSPAYKRALTGNVLSAHPVLAGNLALLLTMLVSGVWHGTTIGFLFFGITHGIYLVIYHSWDHLLAGYMGRKRANQLRKHWLARAVGIAITFNAASFAFLFFQLDTQHLKLLLNGLMNA